MTPLVLIHAFPLDATMYNPLRERLSVPLTSPDLPGFGEASASDDEPSLEHYVDSVVAELDGAGLTDIVLGGTSMGGYVALALARRYPARVRGLALIDTKASADSAEAAAGRLDLASRLDSEGSSAPLLDAVLPKLLGVTTQQTKPDLVARVRSAVEAVDPTAAAWAQRAMAGRTATFDILADLQVPSVVIVGAEDVLTPLTEAEAMVTASAAELVVIEGAGHLTPLEDPDAVAAALQSLLERT